MLKFICGCETKIDPPIDRVVLKTFDSVVYDSEGFLVCLTHHQRLYGWRSVPYRGHEASVVETAGWTPLEWERYRVFGEITKPPPTHLTMSVEDRRDNRDPEELGLALQASRVSENNGHFHIENGNEQLTIPLTTRIPPSGPARWGSG